MTILDELPGHAGAIESLLDAAFGLDRIGKTVYRLRDGVEPVASLSLVAIADGRLVGTIRYWPVLVADATPALLLGPIAVAPDFRSRGVGGRLIGRSLNRAAALGHRSVLLVGDPSYYEPFGFSRSTTLGLTLPGPVDYNRLLGLEIAQGALAGLAGAIGRWDGLPVTVADPGCPATESRPGLGFQPATPA